MLAQVETLVKKTIVSTTKLQVEREKERSKHMLADLENALKAVQNQAKDGQEKLKKTKPKKPTAAASRKRALDEAPSYAVDAASIRGDCDRGSPD